MIEDDYMMIIINYMKVILVNMIWINVIDYIDIFIIFKI